MCRQTVRLPVDNTRHYGTDVAFGIERQPVERTHWIVLWQLVDSVNHQHYLASVVSVHNMIDYLNQFAIRHLVPLVPFKTLYLVFVKIAIV